MATPTVTALRRSGRRVAVELDGAPWRTMPSQAVVDAGLAVGVPLDRERARTLARSLRRRRASELTVRALAQRDRSRSELDLRLEQSGVREGERRDALDRAARAGLVDDVRFAATRARALAERGAGDLLVLDDLARRGIPAKVARAAVSTLEAEHVRAARVVAARGRSLRTLRYLASRGFAPESLDDLVAEAEDRALP